MSYLTFVTLVGLFIGGRLSHAQTATPTTDDSSQTLAPCGQISSSLASYAVASPSAFSNLRIDVSLAQACFASVPLDIGDATKLLDGLSALFEFQSDLEFLASPPSGYLLAGVDLLGEVSNLRSQVQAGDFTSEIEFETALSRIIAAAHDGHTSFKIDGLSTFLLIRPTTGLVSVSEDGQSLPKVYLYDEYYAYLNGTADIPSAVTTLNGVDVVEEINTVVQNTTYGRFQDPDALYNSFFYSWNAGQGLGSDYGAFYAANNRELSPYTNLTFENGTSVIWDNYVVTNNDFTGVVDGESFYASFINTTNKINALYGSGAVPSASETGLPVPTAVPTASATLLTETAFETAPPTPTPTAVSQVMGYPLPEVISEDGALSGYFLTDTGLENTAVLSLRFMTEEAEDSFQDSLTEFLDACRSNNKTHLVLDIIGNPGGRTALGYDILKQLFPTLDPYGAGNYRAHEGFQILGEIITNASSQVMEQQPDNYTAFLNVGGASFFAAETYLDANNERYQSFEEYYGPISAPNNYGNYTNLSRYDLPNPEFDESFGNIIVSGYANESNLAPQPFESENIIMLTDGQCSSTCAILSHFMKSQAKVKAITVGGRPQDGPMQAVGGIKGSLLTPWSDLVRNVIIAARQIDLATAESYVNTSVGVIGTLGDYMAFRTASGGKVAVDLTVNGRNNIAEGDETLTPLQYVYEAADCRIYYQPSHIANISNLWADAAMQSFGLNGTAVFSGCVSGSTNQSSSLSGDAALYNDGNIQNATDVQGPDNSGNGSGGSEGGSNDAGSLKSPATTALLVGIAMALIM